jgi:hypothetical protein
MSLKVTGTARAVLDRSNKKRIEREKELNGRLIISLL